MKKLFTLFISLSIVFSAFSETPVSGTISSNTTWDLAGSPYIVTGNVTVNAGITLTVDDGVEVKFDNGRSLYVYGSVNAINATFTSNDPSPLPGKWNNIVLYNLATATFTGCDFRYGQYIKVDASATLTMIGGSIESMYYYGVHNGGTINITNTIIDLAGYVSTGYGIYAVGSSESNLNGVTIQNCNYGVYIHSDATNSQVNFTDVVAASNVWPVYINSPAAITASGSCDFTGNTRNAFFVGCSAVSGDWTLPLVNVPYYFYYTFTVNNGGSLTIEPENIIKFRTGNGLNVRGLFSADAGIGESIYFSSERDDNWGGDTNDDGTSTAPAVGDWLGIRFFDESDDLSIMRRCKVRYSGGTNYGGVTLFDASPTLDYCEFQQNYFGVYIQYSSDPTISNTTFGSSSLTPIAMSFEANPTFVDNVLSFSDNQYDAIGLIGGTLTANANVIQRNFTTVNNITYVMLSSITVPAGLTLTIAPGIVIKSSTYTNRILIDGKLVADGTSSDWITFTSTEDDNHGNPGDTNKDGTITNPGINDMSGIIFRNGYDPTSIMDYVRMKYTGIYSYYYSNGGTNHYLHGCAVATISGATPSPAGPTISNCEFRESAFGISSYQASNPVISNCSMINISGTPFSLAASANPTFSGNTFTNVGINALGLIGNNVIVNGTLSKRDVAGFTNITYKLLEDINILNGANLEIEAGVVIKIDMNNIVVNGGLKCSGTNSEHVVFTSLRDDNVGNPMDTNGDGNGTSPAAGNWYRLEFGETSDDAYCTVDYTDFKYGGYNNSGLVRTVNASPTFTNCLLDKSSYYGFRFDGNSAPVVDQVTIQNCNIDPIAMSLTSNPTLTDIVFTANGSNGIFILEGTLSTDATLIKRSVGGYSNVAYIMDEVVIASDATLTLEAGLVIKFRSYYFDGIHVKGGLIAIGTPGEKIVFTSIKDDSAGGDTNNDGNGSVPVNTDWDGILYYPEANDAVNKLVYAELRYGGGSYWPAFGSGTNIGAVRLKDSYVQIDNCVFQQGNESAIGIYGSANPSITNCQFNNFNKFPIFMAMFAEPSFGGNTVANMGYTAIGIQDETYSQSATIAQRDFAGYTNITYMFQGATINSGTTITIPAGTVFKSIGNYNLTINGGLVVDGASGNPVVFTDSRDDTYGNPADTEQNGSATAPDSWGPQLIFNDVSDDASYVNYSVFAYRNYPVSLISASPTISNSMFFKNIVGISNSGVCAPIVTNNSFDNLSFAPIAISLVSFPATISGNSVSGSTFKGIAINNETLTQDATLPVRAFAGIDNIPYIFGSYTIGSGVTLTIDPGVVVKFTNNGTITVNNGLMAVGTATSAGNIVFTTITDDFYGGDTNADEDASAPGSIDWNYIRVNNIALDNLVQFENCIFRYSYNSYGAIYLIDASPSFLNCSFNNNYQGIYATGSSNPTINYCDFYNINNYAVNNVNQSFVIDAENNWWGSNSGPTHSGNPSGTGEPVTNSVDYDPWGTDGALNPLAGDVSLNSIIQAYDATLVLLYVVDPITYPLSSTQLQVADVSGIGGVSAMDASLILQYVVGLINTFPLETLAPYNDLVSDVELQIESANVNSGETFDLPVNISNVSGVYSMQMNISYQPELLTALEVENLVPGMNSTYSIDESAGLIRIAFAGIESLEEELTIANLVFKAIENTGTGTEAYINAKFFMANETDLSWNVQDGTVTISGLSTGLNDNQEKTESLLFCYPNPLIGMLNISYAVQRDGDHVFIGVYNMFGQLESVIANGNHSAETYRIQWNGIDENGKLLNNGTYFLRMVSGDKTTTQKIQIVR